MPHSKVVNKLVIGDLITVVIPSHQASHDGIVTGVYLGMNDPAYADSFLACRCFLLLPLSEKMTDALDFIHFTNEHHVEIVSQLSRS